MQLRYVLPALALSAALVACGSSRKTAAPVDAADATVTESAGGLPGSPMMNPLDVLSAVKSAGGLTKLPLATALPIIDGFINALAQRAGSKAITSELESLKSELTSGSIDGGKVGKLLTSLGGRTSEAAGGEGNYAVLGDALAQAGQGLMK